MCCNQVVVLAVLLLLTDASVLKQHYNSTYHANNGSLLIHHYLDNYRTVRLQYENLHDTYPTFHLHHKNGNLPSTYEVRSGYDGGGSSVIDVQNKTINHHDNLNSSFPNTSLPYFNIENIDDLKLCNEALKDWQWRYFINNNIHLQHIANNMQTTTVTPPTSISYNTSVSTNDHILNMKILLTNTTNELLDTRSDLVACMANIDGLTYERNKYAANYMHLVNSLNASSLPQPSRLIATTNHHHKKTSTTTSTPIHLPAPILSETGDIKYRALEWTYASCYQETERLKKKLLFCQCNN